MKKGTLITDSTERSPDIFYATGFQCPDPFIFFSVENEQGIIVSPLEYQRARSETKKGITVFQDSTLFEKNIVSPSKEEQLSALTKKYDVVEWSVPADFPLKYADSLRNEGIKVKASEGIFFPGRTIKNDLEIKAIKKVQSVNEKAMELAASILAETSVDKNNRLEWNKAPLTSEILKSEIEVFLKRNGCTASQTITASGKQCAEPHNTGHGIIEAGKTIIIDIFPRNDSSGYWGDMTRTFVKGKAPANVKRAFQAVFKAKEEARMAARPGIKTSELHNTAFRILEKYGFPTGSRGGRNFGFFHGLGHGVGLEIHEEPKVSPKNPGKLQYGNVITIEPGLYYPEWGGVRIEDLVIITTNGCECLNNPSAELEIP
jgi:Xaa-Pro aminopeptidase